MLKSFLKVAYRGLLKSKLSSFINIFGLSLAVGCTIVIFLIIDFMYSLDSFHENADSLFLVENVIEISGTVEIWGNSPLPLGPALEADFPQVIRAVRVADAAGAMRYGDLVFNESIRFVDPAFLEMFTFPLKYGDKSALSDNSALILSEDLALKYFGDANPIGEQVSITFNSEQTETFLIRGVAEKVPANASFGFAVLCAYNKQFDLGMRLHDWSELTRSTFIQLRNPADIGALADQMDRYVNLQNASKPNRPIAGLRFDLLRDVPLKGLHIRGGIQGRFPERDAVVLTVLALFILSLACFNYVNIAISSAGRRLKEIGIRKAVGSNKLQMVGQFLGENLLICAIALVVGVTLCESFLVPAINGVGLPVSLNFSGNLRLWIFFAGLLMVTGLVAGTYPAFFMSAFQPARIFRGSYKVGRKKRFTSFLLTIQYVISFILIATGVAVSQNAEWERNRDWGYNQKQTIVIPFADNQRYSVYKNAIREHADIQQMAGSLDHIGETQKRAAVQVLGKQHHVVRFDIGVDYIETLQLGLREGRSFDGNLSTDTQESIIVNETFVKKMGWQNAVGKRVEFDDTNYRVIGVVEDFHYTGFVFRIEPATLRLAPEDELRYLAIRVPAGAAIQTQEFLRATWRELMPDLPYEGFFQDSVFDSFQRGSERGAKVFSFAGMVALLISCMGLFGLVSLHIATRLKEISIRKVLGAPIVNIINVVNRQFLILLAIAICVAAPLSYLTLKSLLGTIEYHMPLGPVPFVVTSGLIVLTAVLTIFPQVFRGASANPVEHLRHE